MRDVWPRSHLSVPATGEQYELVPSRDITMFSQPPTPAIGHEITMSSLPPRQLQRYKPGNVSLDIFLMAVCAPFLVLMAIVLQREGRVVDNEDWERIQLGMSISVTAFPLVFSAVAGTLVQRLAAWNLERGSSIMTLEQLNGCSTLINTVSTLVSLRAVNLLGIVLVVLWACSPLGGQSSLYILRTRPAYASSDVPLTYFNSTMENNNLGASALSSFFPFASSLFMASILAPSYTKTSTTDSWGYVKVPILESIPTPANKTGWTPVGSSALNYSSLLGIPVVGLSSTGNTTLAMTVSYFHLNLINTTAPELPLSGKGFSLVSNNTPSVRFQPVDDDTNHLYFSMTRLTVDTQVSCTGTDLSSSASTRTHCAVTAMRPVPETAYNPLDPPKESDKPTFWIQNILRTLDSASAKRFSSTEAYILNPEQSSLSSSPGTTKTVSQSDILLRLSQLINTASLAYYDPAGFFRGTPSEFYMANTTASHTYFDNHRVYEVYWPWMGVYIVATLVMLACALALTVLDPLTLNPEILGYASTALWESRDPNIPVQARGSAMSGDERSKVLSRAVVRFGDVKGEDAVVGRLGVGLGEGVVGGRRARLYE